jgi:hypothetical protein
VTGFEANELAPELDAGERAALVELGADLITARPVPSAGFRGELRRGLLALAGGRRAVPGRPPNLRHLITANLAAGLALLAFAAAGVAGLGPLAPSKEHATSSATAFVAR